MSQDVIIGSTDRSWSRGSVESTESNNPPLTDKEKLRIEQLAQLEMRAARGDVAAQKKMVEINAALADIQKRAKKGDAKAKRLLFTLQGTGLLTLSESKSGPRLIMAGAFGRPKRSTQQSNQAQQVNPAQQVQEFLLSLKMRAMAGDPQAIAILQQYQQIIAPPGAGQPEQPQAAPAMPLDLPPSGMAPESYPPAPMTGEVSSDGSFVGFNGHLAFIRGLGEEEIALAREGGACERAALHRRY